MTRHPELVVVAAVARDGGIGCRNQLPWRLRKDLLRFRAVTMGFPIIMGRNTWASLGRPLPGRRNIVISSRHDFQPAGAERVDSLDAALDLAADQGHAFVIGGAQIYALALPRADRLLLTEVDAQVEADTFFPAWPRECFREVVREHHAADSEDQYPFDFVEYRRIIPA